MINNLFNTDLPGTLVLHVALLVATDMELVLVTARVSALLAGTVQIACQIAPPHKLRVSDLMLIKSSLIYLLH